jgi:Putative beta-barrel porin-2, OmpL-like. bbp2
MRYCAGSALYLLIATLALTVAPAVSAAEPPIAARSPAVDLAESSADEEHVTKASATDVSVREAVSAETGAEESTEPEDAAQDRITEDRAAQDRAEVEATPPAPLKATPPAPLKATPPASLKAPPSRVAFRAQSAASSAPRVAASGQPQSPAECLTACQTSFARQCQPACQTPATCQSTSCGCPTCGCQTPGGCQCGNSCQDQCDCPSICECYRWACRPNHDSYNHVLPQDGLFRVRGWLDAGILGNTSNPASHFNGPYNSQQVDNGQFNQAYIILERDLAQDGSLSVGGRWDLLYGSDYFVAQSNGIERNQNGTPRWNSSQYYGLAMPQAYLEVGTLAASVKVGHFYTIVGYESVQSANNFFYSHAYSYQFAGPFTNSGVLATRKLDDYWQVQASVVNGWNNLATVVNRAAFMGGIKYTDDAQGLWSSFAIITGDEPTNVAGLPNVVNTSANRTRYSFIVSKLLNPRIEYVFHQWLGVQQQGAPGGGAAMWYGIDQYLYYRMNDCWRLGLRTEWFRDQNGTRVGLTEPSNPNTPPLPGSYGSLTVGANWSPQTNIVIRPELRWDTYTGPAKPFDDGTKTYQLLLGCDAMVQF